MVYVCAKCYNVYDSGQNLLRHYDDSQICRLASKCFENKINWKIYYENNERNGCMASFCDNRFDDWIGYPIEYDGKIYQLCVRSIDKDHDFNISLLR